MPFERIRREAYKYQKQLPSDHVENLERYLLIAPSLIPNDPALSQFYINHVDLQPGNIFVSRSPESDLKIVGLIDWQHTPILPKFLLAEIPVSLQNNDDPVSESMTLPSLPDNFDDLTENQQNREKDYFRHRLAHYHYMKNTEELNKLHYAALMEPMNKLRRRLFEVASWPWLGETLELKYELIKATENWETLTGGSSPCPVVFETDDVRETKRLDAEQRRAMRNLEFCQMMVGCAEEGWVPVEDYWAATSRNKYVKEKTLALADSEEERAEITEHWVFDDMDEEEYM